MDLNKLYKSYLENLPMVAIFAAITMATLWYNISPLSFNEYNRVCQSNYGRGDQFQRCMNPYWSQYGLDRVILIISGLVLVVTVLIWAGSVLKNKK